MVAFLPLTIHHLVGMLQNITKTELTRMCLTSSSLQALPQRRRFVPSLLSRFPISNKYLTIYRTAHIIYCRSTHLIMLCSIPNPNTNTATLRMGTLVCTLQAPPKSSPRLDSALGRWCIRRPWFILIQCNMGSQLDNMYQVKAGPLRCICASIPSRHSSCRLKHPRWELQ